ncbi:diguanylate cyclase [Carboxydothermus pertinax]|uniref:Histidine kinase n=1 Tax=Carboxydothermus pertinax TaxID=870242 RepID=A0A1L8CV52_9THEO|nr:diguanylate cyclase [Carboxydothermus pertinax]GAV22782.1 histidine kinase [Carboxydothermus pertinax]
MKIVTALKAKLCQLINELSEDKLLDAEKFLTALGTGENLLEKLYLYEKILDSLPDATLAIDKNGQVIVWNQAMEEMTGVKKEEILGKGDYVYAEPFFGKRKPICVDLVLGNNNNGGLNGYEKLERKGKVVIGEGVAPNAYGGKGACYWTLAAPIEDAAGNLLGAVQCVRDVTERKIMERELKYCSTRDVLTGLYNRAFFEEEVKRMEKGREYPISVLICDLDNLKAVNDMFGHDKGDLLLKRAADILKGGVRQGDVVARIGGDEFGILLPSTSREAAEEIAQRIFKRVEEYNKLAPDLPLSLSIGVSTATKPGTSLWETLREADDAMYRNKLANGNDARVALVKALKTALMERDFHNTDRMKKVALKFGGALKLPREEVDKLVLLVEMHDIGKLGVPESVLNKPEPLSPEERRIIERHPEIGYRIALTSGELSAIAPLILQHHERWDGKGYPQGLKGEEIAYLSRIMAIIDAYDAMLSKRPYRKPLTRKEVLKEFLNGSGSQFDPDLINVFVNLHLSEEDIFEKKELKGEVS